MPIAIYSSPFDFSRAARGEVDAKITQVIDYSQKANYKPPLQRHIS
jgi:hypothetical protein